MEEDFRLNAEQKAYLNSLVCQRISDDEANRELIENFINTKSISLSLALIRGWDKDQKDKLAYYIVKDPEMDVPLMFFSLKCGEVTVPFVPERREEILHNSEMLYAAATNHPAPDWAKEVIEKMRASGKEDEDIVDEFRDRYYNNLKRHNRYQKETIEEGNNIIRVLKAHPGVELVHFCVYDPINWRKFGPLTKKEERRIKAQLNPVLRRWREMGMNSRSLAQTMFWKFVVPIIQDIRKLVGLEYIYLFAADGIKYGDLVTYYEKLDFEIRQDLTVSKPEYDFTCYFMCQKVTSLRNRRNEFFREYNKSEKKSTV